MSNQSKEELFSKEEKAAMRARVKELKSEAKSAQNRQAGEKDLLAAVDMMSPESKAIGTQLHQIISENAPQLMPKTWYGMPAYANADGKVVCFFRGAEKFKERYLTLGFQDAALLDAGAMWPIAYALKDLTKAESDAIAKLVKKAVGG